MLHTIPTRMVIRRNTGLIVSGEKKKAEILVVCDKPSLECQRKGIPMAPKVHELFLRSAEMYGMEEKDFVFITPCEPMPGTIEGSAKREGEFLNTYREDFVTRVNKFKQARMIVGLGGLAIRQVYGTSTKISKIRGVIQTDLGKDMRSLPMLPMLAPLNVLRFPSQEEVFRVDFAMLSRMRDCDFSARRAGLSAVKKNYRWVTGKELVAYMRKNRVFGLDTEGTGLLWQEGKVHSFMVQVTGVNGDGLCCPIADGYAVGEEQCRRNLSALKEFLENPSSDYYATGHNLKFDLHCLENAGLRIPVHRWLHDSMQLAFAVDENLMSKDLVDCTKLFVPELAGYSDEFDKTVDKSAMLTVPPKRMLPYAGGDSDSTFRMTKRLVPLVKRDERHWICYERIQMPALRMFYGVEKRGMRVDRTELTNLAKTVRIAEKEMYDSLIAEVPGSIKRKHLNAGSKGKGTGLAFSRADFVKDILFDHPDGFKFKPVVWTKSTKKLPLKDRVPSVSKKDHLPYFDTEPWVAQLIQYQTVTKLLSTYVGVKMDLKKKKPTGLWKHICEDGYIRPSYFLHRTVTGRTASADPNGQNFPKRGKLAKAYRKIFVPTRGFTFGEVDLSQAELRVAAVAANERTMLKLYKQGIDIHANTAAAVSGIPLEQFLKGVKDKTPLIRVANEWRGSGAFLQDLNPGERKKASVADYCASLRQRAKAVNFGFLYGMGWKKFRSYAKTDYGVTVSEREAQEMRNAFFRNYPGLVDWHRNVRKFVRQHGYVRAIHGAVRHLPNIRSYDEGVQSEAERQAINSPIQRFASDLGLMGAIQFEKDCPKHLARIVAFVHDSVVLEIKEGHEAEIMSALKWYLENPPLEEWFGIELPLPIVADTKAGQNLGEMNDLHVAAKRPIWFSKN